MRRTLLPYIMAIAASATCGWCFEVDNSPQPAAHPPQEPTDGAVASTNPPSMIWRLDDRAATYTLELCQRDAFDRDVIRVEGVDMPLYNHSAVLARGRWYWRWLVVTAKGEVSEPSPVRSFIITPQAPKMPVPPTDEILRTIPDHPRVFVTPETLGEFRARRDTVAKQAWEDIKHTADAALKIKPRALSLQPMPEKPSNRRKQVFYLRDGQPMVARGYTSSQLNSDASRANALSLAYLISGDERYAKAAREWLLLAAPFRMDYHLKDRGQHDTVVYNYEYGLKGVALAYDRLYDLLTEQERGQVVDHIVYHCANAYKWVHDRLKLHLNYQNSHGQQCMHALLTTVLAVADETEQTKQWADWLIRQYANRMAWGAEDGGYTEGQTYSHKFQFILEALAAMRTATGIDVFCKPRLRNAGDFWLYCMSLNYWWNHWGDVYSLLIPVPGASADTYIAGFLASMSGSPYVTWWSDTVLGNPRHVPLWYLSSTGVAPKPPVDIAQARVFPDVGQLAAYDRFYDHRSPRIFFRSSPWGSASHAHADQNGFVLHAGGEILACDSGYYTYYGDSYHKQFSVTTAAHNSILVNGKGQPKSVTSRGRVSAFLSSADYCLFIGDATEAYPGLLDRFDRVVVMLRPGVFIVYDELQANAPSEFTWVLNTFEAAQIDEDARTMVVRQGEQRLRVQHLAPADLSYIQSNERPFPMLTKSFCRYTEAFPQPYNIRVTTDGKQAGERILTLMDTYNSAGGPQVEGVRRIDTQAGVAMCYDRDGITETMLFRRREDEGTPASVDGIHTDARVVSVGRDTNGTVVRWLMHHGTKLVVDGRDVFAADGLCDAAGQMRSPSCMALIQIKHEAAVAIEVALPDEPRTVLGAPPNMPAQARELSSTWRDGRIVVSLPEAGESVLWVDPAMDITRPPEPLPLIVTDGSGEYQIELETAIADNGEVVAFGRVAPREPGLYTFEAGGQDAEILVQDRWDTTLSAGARGTITAPWREEAEVFVRFGQGEPPTLRASLAESYRGKLVNLLRNGSFEEGSPGYPPRTWTISHPRKMGFTWPYWSQEDAVEGRSCLKFVRPSISMTLTSQPMRLLTSGPYVLQFSARGTATHAEVAVSGRHGSGTKVAIEPGEDWREYRVETPLEPGYTTVQVSFRQGGDPDQVLWLDDVQFGYVPQ